MPLSGKAAQHAKNNASTVNIRAGSNVLSVYSRHIPEIQSGLRLWGSSDSATLKGASA